LRGDGGGRIARSVNPECVVARLFGILHDPETGKKFYDLGRDPVVSPYTGKSYPLSFFEQTARAKPIAERANAATDDDETEEEEAIDPAAPEVPVGLGVVPLDPVDQGGRQQVPHLVRHEPRIPGSAPIRPPRR